MAHGNPTDIHYTGARNICSLDQSGNGLYGAGKKLPAEFFGIQVFQDSSRSDFRRGEIKNFKQEKKRKESTMEHLYRFWRCPCDYRSTCLPIPRPLGGARTIRLGDGPLSHDICPQQTG